jgi:hypothetical protein
VIPPHLTLYHHVQHCKQELVKKIQPTI